MTVPSHERVRWWREHLGLRQDELAERCAMPQSKISRIETGSISLATEDLETIVRDGLRTTMVEFYRAKARAA